MHARKIVSALCLSGIASQAALADEPVLPDVLVRAKVGESLSEDSIANPFRVSPSSRSSVQILGQEEIAALNPRDVFDLLSHAVGVLPMSQGRKVPMHVQIRGDVNFAYIIDGAYLERDTGSRLLASLPLSAIERIEVVRDSTALSLGPMINFTSPSGAPNDGFIVIRTKQPTRSGGMVKGGVENRDTWSADVGGAVVGDGWYVGANGRRFSSEGPDDAHSARDSETGLAKAGFRREKASLDVLAYRDNAEFQFQRADASQSTAALVNMRWSFDPIQTTLFALNGRASWNDENTTLLSVYRNELRAMFQQGSFVAPAVTSHDNTDTTWGASLRHSFRRGGTLLQVGGQYAHWETPTGQLFYEYNPREEKILGGFIQVEQRLFGDRLTLDGAYRRDQKTVVLGVDSYGHAMSFTNSVIRDRKMPVAQFLSLGASWKPAADWLVNARYAYGKQSANLGVVAEVGVALGDEAQRKYELSIAYRGFAWLVPKLTVFRTEVDNYKYPTRFDAATQQAVYDQMDARRTGVELDLSGHLAGSLRWHLAWTHIPDNNLVDDHGRTAPTNLGVFDVSYGIGAWEINGAIQRVGGYASNFFSPGGVFAPIGNFTRYDLSLARNFKFVSTPLKLMIYGRNLSDEKYQTQLGYRDPGRVVGVSAELSF